MFEYIEAMCWGVFIVVLIYYLCDSLPPIDSHAIVDRLKASGAQQVMTPQPPVASTSAATTTINTTATTATPSTSSTTSTSTSTSTTTANTSIPAQPKVFFKTAKTNPNLNTEFLAKATPVLNVREQELAKLQEAHVVAKGREIVASAIGEESRGSRASFSEDVGRATPVYNVRGEELAQLQEAHVVAKGREIAENVIGQESLRASASEEGRGRRRSLSTDKDESPAKVSDPVLSPGSPFRSSFSDEDSSRRERRGSTASDFVMLHSGPSPASSPTMVSNDHMREDHNPVVAVRVEGRDGTHEVCASSAMKLGAFRQLVSSSLQQANLELRLAGKEGILSTTQDDATLEELGLLSNPHLLATKME